MSVVNNAYKAIESNYAKGNLGESSVQDAFRLFGYSVEVHKVSDKGVDVLAMQYNSITIGEVLNWSCKGYIHNQRFRSIVDSLSRIADNRYLFAFGVSPTASQRKLLNAYNIKLVHFKDSIKKITKSTISMIAHAIESVITSIIEVSVSVGYCFTGFIVDVFSCNLLVASNFDWYRRLRKRKFVRNFMFKGVVVSWNQKLIH